MIRSLRLLILLLPLLTACYEDRAGCLDPDAANYDLVADEDCPACCAYPALSVRLTTVWGEDPFVAGDTYTDGAGNDFQVVAFRYYLGDLRLLSAAADLPEPQRPLVLTDRSGAQVNLNGNYLLASTAPSTTGVGAFRLGQTPVSGFAGTYGLPERYRNIEPASAPPGDALRTQPRRLNFLDDRGYAQARLEYTTETGGDTLSVSAYGSEPFAFTFAEAVTPSRGADLQLDLEADLEVLLGGLDLAADSTIVADGIRGRIDFLRPVAISF